jgi:hypothetical protein
MAYTINKHNNTTITVADDTLNVETSLRLVGKDYIGYGEAIAQNSVSLLENFASETAPTNPIEGQHWWKPSTTLLNIYHNGSWLGIDAGTGVASILDTNGIAHSVYVTRANGIPVTITSSDTTAWAIAPTETDYHQYFLDNGAGNTATINSGINLNTVVGSAMKFHGTATHAQYADVAEMYTADQQFEAGTLIMFSDGTGAEEVTETQHQKDPKILGVVTTDPALLMNSKLTSTDNKFAVGVALLGRVPCKVVGKVNKGDRICSSDTKGHGMSADINVDEYTWKHVIGRALESKSSEDAGTIEVIVGVK